MTDQEMLKALLRAVEGIESQLMRVGDILEKKSEDDKRITLQAIETVQEILSSADEDDEDELDSWEPC